MTKKITDIFKEKDRTYSFEFFVPKTEQGIPKLFNTVKTFKQLTPDFVSVTYGAGGTTASKQGTMNIVDEIQRYFNIPTMHHITCVRHSRQEIKGILKKLREKDIPNVLALHGDPPLDAEDWEPHPDGFEYSYQLCQQIKSYDDFFNIGVAGFPEGHIDCPDKQTDSKYLKIKIDSGAEFIITQIFFDNKDYFEYVDRIRKAGVKKRIIPSILPITNYQNLVRFCRKCGTSIPQEIHNIFKHLDANNEATYKAGVKFAVKQCNELLEKGAPGLHFITLNKIDPTREILNNIKR